VDWSPNRHPLPRPSAIASPRGSRLGLENWKAVRQLECDDRQDRRRAGARSPSHVRSLSRRAGADLRPHVCRSLYDGLDNVATAPLAWRCQWGHL